MICRITLTLLALASLGQAQTTLTIHADRPTTQVSPTLYGIFFEEINRAGDGGLYPELINNRSFEDSDEEPLAWDLIEPANADASPTIDTAKPLNDVNLHALRLHVGRAGSARVGIVNNGFHNMAIAAGTSYRLSLRARSDSAFQPPLVVSLETQDGKILDSHNFSEISTANWKQFDCVLKPTDTSNDARLVIAMTSAGTVWLDMVSLMPDQKFKGMNLRPDLAQKLDDLKPAFIRFPGGCWVEGETLALAYRWKQTIGPIDRRRNQFNLWKYNSSHGIGYHEYLQLAELLKAEPLFVINCGMSHKEVAPMDKMGEYVQDALDAIEYANGSVDTKYGAMRAQAGHPAPFNLKYIEIGNENGGKEYDQRYALFYDAIKKKYPEINLIADLWHGSAKSRPIEILDEHYYSNPAFFIRNANRYDSYNRKGPKIYVGEYAVTQGCGTGNLAAAIGEAAFMTGMERNSDVVVMASYAPLFANVHFKGWNPNAINFDASRSYGTPSYYVQQMFAQNRADKILPIEIKSQAKAPEPLHGAVGIGTWETQAEFKDIQVTQGTKSLFTSDFAKSQHDVTKSSGEWTTKDNTLAQTSPSRGTLAVMGDPAWTDYTLILKAKKVSGKEGFIIRFNAAAPNDFLALNLGGWGNVKHAVQRTSPAGEDATIISPEVPGKIEVGRWYDIRIETTALHIKTFLDDKPIHDFEIPIPQSLYTVAGRTGNHIIIKTVNVTSDPQPATLTLNGVNNLQPKATALTLTGNPLDENSLDNPTKIAPQSKDMNATSTFSYTFPPNSVTVLRFHELKEPLP
jgi:alpha-L-arabinofuranosidase